MKDTYMLIAHKPYSSDYCKGCLMASYEEDTQIHMFDNMEDLCQKVIEIESRQIDGKLEYGESGYGCTIMCNGEILIDDSEIIEDHRSGFYDGNPEKIAQYGDRIAEIVWDRKKKQEEEARLAEERKQKASIAAKAAAKKKKEENERKKLRELAERYPEELTV